MGQKVHPYGMRLGIIYDGHSRWFAKRKKTFVNFLHTDIKARNYLMQAYNQAGISRIMIERPSQQNAHVIIHCARPGVIIGKKGSDVEKLRREVANILQVKTHISVEEVRKPELDAKLVAEGIANALERRVPFRKAVKRTIQNVMRAGAQGVKISVSGRLGGAEIARTEWVREGRIPLHTFRADIDYALIEASTTYGIIGVKVWVFKGEVLPSAESSKSQAADK